MAYKLPKPVIRQEAWLNLQSDLVKTITNSHVFQNCLNCKHWDFAGDICGKFKTKPPTDIIVNSCPEYEDGFDIPF